MELKQLIYFKCVADVQHMTLAAARLGVTQPYLSRVISALEKELGAELFDHVGRGIRLNRNGEQLYACVSDVLKRLDATCQELKLQNQTVQDTSITIASNVALYIPGLLEFLRKRAPELRINYTTANVEHLLEQLTSQTVDFILCSPCLPETQSMESHLVHVEECPVIYPPGHWLSRARDVRLTDLRNEPFVGVKKGYGIRDTSDQFFAQVGLTPSYTIETSDTRTVWELVKSGCGLAFTSFTTLIHDPVLRENYMVLTEPSCQGTVGLSYLKKHKRRHVFSQFADMTSDYFRDLKKNAWLSIRGG